MDAPRLFCFPSMLQAVNADFCATGDPGWTGVRYWGGEVAARREPWRGVDLSAPVDHPVQPVS